MLTDLDYRCGLLSSHLPTFEGKGLFQLLISLSAKDVENSVCDLLSELGQLSHSLVLKQDSATGDSRHRHQKVILEKGEALVLLGQCRLSGGQARIPL